MKNNDYHNLLINSQPESYNIWFEEERKYLAENITKGAYVLEVGSGDGRSIYDLLPLTKNIIGIDHDENAIKETNEKFSEFSEIEFILASAEKLPFEDGKFDFVICMTSFANFAGKKYEILEEMKRVLNPKGKIIISVYSQNALPERMKVYKNVKAPIIEVKENGAVIFDESLGDNISEQFTKDQLIEIFGKAHLKIEEIKEVNIAYLCKLSK